MKENEVTYQIWGYIWNEAKADRDAEAYEFVPLKSYKTERGARAYLDKFAITNDIPQVELYRDETAWDGRPIEHERIALKDSFGIDEY